MNIIKRYFPFIPKIGTLNPTKGLSEQKLREATL